MAGEGRLYNGRAGPPGNKFDFTPAELRISVHQAAASEVSAGIRTSRKEKPGQGTVEHSIASMGCSERIFTLTAPSLAQLDSSGLQ